MFRNRVDAKVEYPWESSSDRLRNDELNKEIIGNQFMPSGAMVAGRIDEEHWLTFAILAPCPYSTEIILF